MSDESIYEIESLYIYYHKLKTCYYMDYKHYIKWNRIISTFTIISTTPGVVAGGITLNPVILGVISGTGLLLSGIKELLKYEKKSEKAYFAYCEFNKVLCALRNARRTGVFNKNIFLETEKRLEDFIIDFAIPIRNSSEKECIKTYDIEIKDKYQNYFNKIRGLAPG